MPAQPLFGRKENTGYIEYRRKIQALLSFIVARTELQLYDLSPSSGAQLN
jgi:hypothetical protein